MQTKRDHALDLLKITALISMTIDHIRHVLPEYQNLLVTLGRWAFPLFAFLIASNTHRAIGSGKTDTLKRYFFNLVIFSIISEVPYRLMNGTTSTLNIMPTLLLGFLLIVLLNSNLNKAFVLFVGTFSVVMLAAVQQHLEYGLMGVFLIIAMYYYVSHDNKLYKNIFFFISIALALICNLQYLITVLQVYGIFNIYTAPIMISIICVMLYMRFIASVKLSFPVPKTGKFLWWYYPVHMLIIYFIGVSI